MRPLFSLLQQALRIIHEEPLGFKNGQWNYGTSFLA
jgi:hypothetical protein